LAGEIAIQETSKRFTIVRTAWVYGRHGKNFLKTILRVALTDPQRQLKVVHDQFGSLTWSYRLAHQLKKLLDEGGQGIYHATAEGFCTWYEVATHFFNRMRVTNRVIPCTTSDYPTPARRPHNSILENRRLKEYGINVMRHWQEDLDEFVARHREALWQEAVNPNLI
jgi:dTDP-4-dehydrorhamnose reductase